VASDSKEETLPPERIVLEAASIDVTFLCSLLHFNGHKTAELRLLLMRSYYDTWLYKPTFGCVRSLGCAAKSITF